MEIIKRISKYTFSSNCYIISEGNKGICIDPGITEKEMQELVSELKLDIIGIFITHSHFDHIRSLKLLYDLFHCDIYVSKDDEVGLFDYKINCSEMSEKPFSFSENDFNVIPFDDGEVIDCCNLEIKCILTPFHSMGSACFYIKSLNALFTGDTLFKNNIGRTDLITSKPYMVSSSLNKLKKLPKKTIIYPGHNQISTLENEFISNPYFK